MIYHKPSGALGARRIVSHQVPLSRFSDSPHAQILPSPTWSSSTSGTSFPGLHYSIGTSKAVYAPDDELELDVFTHVDETSSHQIKKIQVTLDRHIVVDSPSPSPSGSDEEEVFIPDDDTLFLTPEETSRVGRPNTKALSSLFDRSTSSSVRPTPTTSPCSTPSPEVVSYISARTSTSPPSRTMTAGSLPGIKTSTVTQIMVFEENDVPSGVEHKIVGVVPRTKSLYRYSIGETLRTKLANVQFRLSIKIHVKSRTGSIEVVELPSLPIALTAASNQDRENALASVGRLFAIADAELRLFHPSVNIPLTSVPNSRVVPSKGSALADRRASGFMLGMDVDNNAGLELVKTKSDSGLPPPRGGDLPHIEPILRNFASVRKRTEQQWEGVEAPVRSKQRIARTKKEGMNLRSRSPSRKSRPATSPVSPSTPNASSTATYFHPHPLSLGFDTTTRQRRSARVPGLYSALGRPRSSGGLSAISHRSRDENSAGSHSNLSLNSLGSSFSGSSRFTPEKSAALPTSSTSHEVLLLPLSLYPSTSSDSDIPPFDENYLGIVIPDSPSPSFTSDCSTTSGTPPLSQVAFPAVDFNAFSLRSSDNNFPQFDSATRQAIAPWIVEDVSPLDRARPAERFHVKASRGDTASVAGSLTPPSSDQRRSSTSVILSLPTTRRGSHASPSSIAPVAVLSPANTLRAVNNSSSNRRRSSTGFGLFGKSSSGEHSEKESGRWAFLRRGSKAS